MTEGFQRGRWVMLLALRHPHRSSEAIARIIVERVKTWSRSKSSMS